MKTLICITLLCSLTRGQSPSQSLLSLVASERAFAAATAELGIRNGFLTFFADDAITFEPDIGLYADVLGRRPGPTYPLTIQLRWTPEEGDISDSADIGYLTGPYTVESATASKEPSSSGWYFSIWKRQPNDIWKVFIDIGIETPSHGIDIDSMRFTPAPLHGTGALGGTREGLESADAAFNNSLSDTSPALGTHSSGTVRFHRNGWFPINGIEEATSYFSAHPYGTATALSAHVSRSGDLGYSYGTYKGLSARGYYVRMWKYTTDHSWKVVLDVTTEKR